ncbi:DUF3309 domain-containing protein [Paraburkholderia edwinii]|uniref:DUF3309 domain-containing protein n=1 Tax=Paraburkholderia edwinii TaxID=2861782 RepID=A0ABX8UQ63_9BURK|nr:DUF3309 domain-containing protein [Paraburkholderia edwinii]
MGVLVPIVAVVLLVSALPRWPPNRRWGYFPSSAPGVVALAVLVRVLMGKT